MDQEKDQKTKRTCLGVLGCFGGLLLHLVIGSLYQWGIISVYITSYYNISDNQVTLETNAIAFPLMMISIGLTMRLGLFLSELTHPLIVLTINQILSAAFIFISSFMSNVIGFIVFYGILFGLVAGLTFMIPIYECNKYFPGYKMYVNGVILIGTGLGSVVFGLFSYNFLNPNKKQPLEGLYVNEELKQIALQVPLCLRYLGLLYLLIGLGGVIMIAPLCFTNRSQQKVQIQEVIIPMQSNLKQQDHKPLPRGGFKLEPIQNINVNGNGSLSKVLPEQNINQGSKEVVMNRQAATLSEAFCAWVCWLQVIVIFLGSCGVFLVNGNFKTYVKQQIVDDEFLTIIGVVGSIGNGFSRYFIFVSRFFWNLLFSRTGYKTVILLNLSINIVVLSTIRFTIFIPSLYLIMVFLINCCLGGFLVMAPTLAQAVFGQSTGSNIYGFYWEVFAFANLLQYLYVSQASLIIGFDNVIYICLAMCCIAVPFVIFFKFQGPWLNSLESLEYCSCCKDETDKRQEMDQQ